jgi:hypothetical protein
VCGRTLLRGERTQFYLDGSTRRSVCELCTARAMEEGWIREGTLPPADDRDGRSDRRRSLIGRLRRRRERGPVSRVEEIVEEWSPPDVSAPEPLEPSPAPAPPPVPAQPAPVPAGGGRASRVRDRLRGDPQEPRERPREPRRVHAVPTSDEHKISSAVEVFNGSEHRRTVAGVARSLGAPAVSVRPVSGRPSVVNVVVAWELCWYRYEIDLSDDVPGVRVADQGIELEELAPEERQPNAFSDEAGSLGLGV